MGRKIPRFYIQGEEYWVTTPDPTPEDEIEEFLDELFGMPL